MESQNRRALINAAFAASHLVAGLFDYVVEENVDYCDTPATSDGWPVVVAPASALFVDGFWVDVTPVGFEMDARYCPTAVSVCAQSPCGQCRHETISVPSGRIDPVTLAITIRDAMCRVASSIHGDSAVAGKCSQ